MALQASALPREFFYNGSRIPDPSCLAGCGSAAMNCWRCSPRERQRRHRKRIYCLRGICNAKPHFGSPKRSQKRSTASAGTTHIPSTRRRSCCHYLCRYPGAGTPAGTSFTPPNSSALQP
jgi:hypothetical protein